MDACVREILGVSLLIEEAHANRIELEARFSSVAYHSIVFRTFPQNTLKPWTACHRQDVLLTQLLKGFKSWSGHCWYALVDSLEHQDLPHCPMLNESDTNQPAAELARLKRVLEVAKRNGNKLFVDNIEREINAVQRGDDSPLIKDYLTEEERLGRRPGQG